MTFSDHARRQMAHRRITATEVTEAIENQETSYPGRARRAASSSWDGRLLAGGSRSFLRGRSA